MRALLAAAVLLSAGCAVFGPTASPQSFDERLAAAQIAETAVVKAATDGVNAGTLSSAHGDQVLGTAREIDGYILGAKQAQVAGDTATAGNSLQLAMTALTALQAFVNQQSEKQAGGHNHGPAGPVSR